MFIVADLISIDFHFNNIYFVFTVYFKNQKNPKQFRRNSFSQETIIYDFNNVFLSVDSTHPLSIYKEDVFVIVMMLPVTTRSLKCFWNNRYQCQYIFVVIVISKKILPKLSTHVKCVACLMHLMVVLHQHCIFYCLCLYK